ncbi:putative chorismate pyruvate-lyase [Paraferrimonas sedimenticola]|uniref:Probable chorismate pyruvate-lyase n=2 Tax=Paraferrimonas sedimenticola TaxID=375674 RepID=A0AA37RVJ8_9GAMM|nr:putative chorismate pyruvate-lyase [Paraferrimonas sedimenticola]
MQLQGYPYGGQAQWAEASTFADFPEGQFGQWLASQDSLTQRLKALELGFEVQVVGESMQQMPATRVEALDNPNVWVREVILRLNDEPWVFARTVIPQALLHACGVDFTQLGKRPLGEILFATTPFEQGSLSFTRHAPQAHLLDLLDELGIERQTLWGRRRPFHYDNQVLTVAETFLPAAGQYLQAHS